LRAAPITVQAKRTAGAGAELAIPRHAGALTSIDELNRQASGWGLISVGTTRGIVRRIPLVASVRGTLVPTLALEMLRVAYRAPSKTTATGGAVTSLGVGATPAHRRTGRCGTTRASRRSLVSAIDVLEDRVDPALLRKQMAIGPTAFALQRLQDTPIGEQMSGSEIRRNCWKTCSTARCCGGRSGRQAPGFVPSSLSCVGDAPPAPAQRGVANARPRRVAGPGRIRPSARSACSWMRRRRA
jgi:hypothetical protein